MDLVGFGTPGAAVVVQQATQFAGAAIGDEFAPVRVSVVRASLRASGQWQFAQYFS